MPVEIDPQTAARLQVANGDVVKIESARGSIEAPAYVHPGAIPGVASMGLGGRTTRDSLSSSMDDAFRLARRHEVLSIAVPAVGTGIAGFAIDECARVMAESLGRALSDGWQATEIRFVLFSEDTKRPFEAAFWSVFQRHLDAIG